MMAEVRVIENWALLYRGPSDFVRLQLGVVTLMLSLFGVQRYDSRQVLVLYWPEWT